MERLTREDWKNENSMMWEKVNDLNIDESVKKSMKDVLKKLAEYEDLEDQGKLLKLPCDTVWFILERNTEHAAVMSKPVRDLTIYEIEGIDKKGYYWSTEELAKDALDADMEKRIDRRTMDSMIADICNKYKA